MIFFFYPPKTTKFVTFSATYWWNLRFFFPQQIHKIPDFFQRAIDKILFFFFHDEFTKFAIFFFYMTDEIHTFYQWSTDEFQNLFPRLIDKINDFFFNNRLMKFAIFLLKIHRRNLRVFFFLILPIDKIYDYFSQLIDEVFSFTTNRENCLNCLYI